MKSERADTYQGKPARLLELQLKPQLAEDEKKPKEATYTAQIWLGPDGLPLGASFKQTLKVSAMLITVETSTTEEMSFSPTSQRLMIRQREERLSTKSLGIEALQRFVTVFTPK